MSMKQIKGLENYILQLKKEWKENPTFQLRREIERAEKLLEVWKTL